MVRRQLDGQRADGYDPRNRVHRRQKRLSDLARAVTVGWIGHPAVAREVVAARPALELLVEPLALPDQYVVSLVVARFLDATPYWPDGTEWPNPFNFVSETVREDAARIGPPFVDELRGLAMRIESAGAHLDPNDVGVLLVLAQLALLEPDLTRPAGDLADDLNLLPPGGFDRSAALLGQLATHSSRHGRSVRFQADLAASAEIFIGHVGPPAIRQPYSGGRKRATRTDTLALRKALALLVAQDPSLTPTSLLGLVGGADHPALDQLRSALGAKTSWQPNLRTIDRNWPKSRH
jgi:hypothetical protein